MRQKVTCPETGHLEEIEATVDPVDGHIVGLEHCSRWDAEHMDCDHTCAKRLNQRLPNLMQRERAEGAVDRACERCAGCEGCASRDVSPHDRVAAVVK